MLNKNFVDSVCHLNFGKKQCRYLSKIENSNNYICLKKTKSKLTIDCAIKDYKNLFKNAPVGDNCCGIEVDVSNYD